MTINMTINRFLVSASLPALLSSVCLADFSGPYAPENWTFIPSWPTAPLLHTADMLTLDGGESGGNTDIIITAVATGTWSFDWSYVSRDTADGFDSAYYLRNDEAVFLATAAIWDPPKTGSVSILIEAGDTIGFRMYTSGGYGPGFLTITNFQAPVPTPAILAALGLGLTPVRRRRTAP